MVTISSKDFFKKGDVQVISSANSGPGSNDQMQNNTQNNVAEFGKGFVKGALGTVKSIEGLGKFALDKVGIKAEGLPFPNLDASNPAQKAGKVTETIAEFLLPFAKTAKVSEIASETANVVKKVAGKTTDLASQAPEKVAKAVLGEADTQIVKSGQNPMVELFKSGKKRVSDVVNTVEKGIDTFVQGSKKALQTVKDSIPDILIHPSEIATRVNQGIMNSVQHSADYKGIKQGFETVDDIINSGILKPEESQRVAKVVEFIGKWKDNSARGALNLKEALSNFYATGENYTGSNAIIRSIQRNLVNLVGETAPEIKSALKKASGNIDKTEEFMAHLFGKDSVTGESKILTLARNLADKAKNGYKIDLVKELEKVSGMKISDDLQGIYDYLQSSKLKAPGLQNPIETVKYGVKKAIEKGVKLK